MKVTDIVCTGYPVTGMPRARDFYENKLGLSPTVYEMKRGALGMVRDAIGHARHHRH